MAYNTTDSAASRLLNYFHQKNEETTYHEPYEGLIIASHRFNEPYPLFGETDLLCLATFDLLTQFVYPLMSGKFTISATMMRFYGEEITFTLGSAIPLPYPDGQKIPYGVVFHSIYDHIQKYYEIYEHEPIVKLSIRAYVDAKKKDMHPLSLNEREHLLISMIQSGLSEVEPTSENQNHKRSYITALKPKGTKPKAFIVADTETLLIDNVHKPYAAGLMLVRPGEKIDDIMIDTYFSEDYSIILDSFEERSTKVFKDLVFRISTIARQEGSPFTIYFHNFSRFDGILLLKHLACHHKSYKLKPLMRNNRLYELSVYSDKKLLFRFRDSLNLLPGKLDSLAKSLCPELGSKGDVDHKSVNMKNLASRRNELIDYMKQDILLLGGVMQKAQALYCKLYNIDIVSKITHSALALSIFRMKYYDVSHCPIHIPNKNEDTFLRRAYYGGHTDAYKPYGENLYYYDVNSLYPFVMKEFQMPGGVPVWHRNLEGRDLDSIFGFIEAYVVCPKSIKKPFLPYRDKNNTLLFPTGEFVGVYYSEELKYARSLGYTVIPISGYLFEKMESPFKDFVSSLFESRLEAQKDGNDALSYVYKILMNSLYGRFGINPKSTTTEICDQIRYKDLIRRSELIFADMISENNYIVAYHINTGSDTDYWNPPKNAAVQLAAAITASARIYMYPYISREDCYYTDTDSVVLGQPLPEDEISSSVPRCGKFKLEDLIMKGYFLAPKSYFYTAIEGTDVLKYKGPAKKQVYPEWFKAQYADPSHTELVPVESYFRIDWHTLNITKKESMVRLGIKQGSKRKPVYQGDVWIDTEPIDITDLSSLDHIGRQIIKSLQKNLKQLQIENLILNQKLDQIEREIHERNKERLVPASNVLYKDMNKKEKIEQNSLTEHRTPLDKEDTESDVDTETDQDTKKDVDTETDLDTKEDVDTESDQGNKERVKKGKVKFGLFAQFQSNATGSNIV